MPKPRKPVRTDEGEELPPNPNADVAAAIHLLEYARSRGFRVGPVLEVGSVKMHINDLRQQKNEKLGGDPRPVDRGIYAEHGLNETDIPADGTAG